MVVDNIAEFSLNNKYREKFISIDYGVKYLGLAISDETNLISKPFLTLNETDLLSQFTKILDENNIYGLIIGKPYNLDGSISKMIGNVNLFVNKILKIHNIPIFLIDERLTSKQFKSKENSQKNNVHEKSACLILDDFLALYRNYING
tara:strand:- start:185 stop:628 length:444 start_codon:yes stop_codon:yes gene_type:complete